MTLTRRRRRVYDAVAAAILAVAVAVTTTVLWVRSDVRATTLETAAAELAIPDESDQVPTSLREIWRAATDPAYGAVASPYGSVVTADAHTVRGLDAQTGTELWSYTRENVTLCAIGSGDWRTDGLERWTGVHGIMTLFAKNGYCSQVTDLNPTTGERLFQRTSPGSDPGVLIFGTPYVGWVGRDYLELWRHDLVATLRYGNQPNPVNANGPHLECEFHDAAVTADQLATIESCPDGLTVALNWPTPSDAPGDHGWDTNHTEPKATIPLAADAAAIVHVTADRVAILLSDGSLVTYDDTGARTGVLPTDVSSGEIAATSAAGITPTRIDDDRRYTLVGSHLLAVSARQVEVPDPDAESDDSEGDDESDSGSADAESEPATKAVDDPVLDWIAADALGLPAVIGDSVLVPIAGALEVRDRDTGEVTATIPVDRGDYAGRVDVRAVGSVLVETRGDTVVALGQ